MNGLGCLSLQMLTGDTLLRECLTYLKLIVFVNKFWDERLLPGAMGSVDAPILAAVAIYRMNQKER